MKSKFYVAYFDILGYGVRIKNKSLQEEFDIQKHFIDDINKLIKSSKDIIKCDTLRFSDTCILYSKDFGRIIRGSLLFMLVAAVRKVPYFPVRGAISYGEFLFNKGKNIIIGSALREAYSLANKQEWMGCSLSDSCYNARIGTVPFKYYVDKGVLVEYNVPLKDNIEDKRYVINIESFGRVWGSATKDMPTTNPEFIKNIFINKGEDEKEILELDDAANLKLKNTQDFFTYIEKIKSKFQ